MAPAAGSMMGILGAQQFAEVETSILLGAVAGHELANMNPWVFVLLLILYVACIINPTNFSLIQDANWEGNINEFSSFAGANVRGLDTSLSETEVFVEFRSKMGDLLLSLVLSEGRAGFHPNRFLT